MILIAQERVITLVRPKKHSIHPSGTLSCLRSRPAHSKCVPTDLHILVNTVHSPSIVNSSAAASWVPVCLPKFDSAAFVNAYVMFLRKDSGEQTPTPRNSVDVPADSVPDAEGPAESAPADNATILSAKPSHEVGLICVSGSADFEGVRNWCDTVSHVCL